ncbi:MAG: hypothetical protein RBR01_07715 [Desulfobacterales bacterium]|jgi:uncharacterized paraquat-inducible protein A|nr:hypothetical protein [Desulfobacterales bacterium]MDD3081430.1 hypothetical protein [Desulfobacterales bacterium]MDD3950746.1 hypothetical protein [Desulfobacterales bacterium]MDD4464371.1 hypothetical protein [Desulfobacterales bacterium]MDY0378310.1 hypothetical protein [Desulfobacterales bacterium]
MDTVIFGEYALWVLLTAARVVIIVLILYWMVKIFLNKRKKRKNNHHYQVAVCPHCGWQGEVSIHASRCPRCNRPLGDRKIDGGY